MKVLFIAPKFYPSIGGVEKHVLEISKRLAGKGYEVTVLTEYSPKHKNTKFKNYQSIAQSDTQDIKLEQPVKSSYFDSRIVDGIKIYYFKFGKAGWFKKFRIWQTLFKHRSLLKDADIVHCHDVFFWYLPFRFFFPWKKIYTTFHGYESYPLPFKNVILHKVSELLSNGNISVGAFIKKWYGTNPDFIIYGGVNIPKNFKQVERPRALFFGRLDEQTGVETYRKAANLLKKQIPKFKLDIFGNGKLKKRIKEAKDVDSRIESRINDYRFIFVSRYLSILEAMAAKKMVFAVFDNPIKEDYLKLSPFAKFINILSNEKDLASKVQFYYSNKNIEQKMINDAYQWAKTQSWDAVVSVYEKLWRR